MLAGGGPDVVAPESDGSLDGVNRAVYLTVSPATASQKAMTDDD
jgi:hypothetical protein